jgi:glycosyltransferase involved in cell wall biosynthesis
MTNKPLISIILPCYNGEKYLAMSIQSCIKQEYQHWELIIVDDCSTDGSPAIMQEFVNRDKRIKMVRNQINLKTPASLNVGFGSSQGEYITWTSDDNCYLPNALNSLLYGLREQKADAIYSGFFVIDDNDNCIEVCFPEDPENLLYHYTAGASFLYKRTIHETLSGYDTNMFLIEDYDFWLRTYLANFKIGIINELLYIYRRHQQALTHRRAKDMWKAAYLRIFDNVKYIDKYSLEFQRKFWNHFAEKLTIYILADRRTRQFFWDNVSHIRIFAFFLIIMKRIFRKATRKTVSFGNYTDNIKNYLQEYRQTT